MNENLSAGRQADDALVASAIEYALLDGENVATVLDNMIGEVVNARSFADAEVLTLNAGLVLELADGSEFQITVVRSR